MSNQTVYALLVGIDTYQPPVPALAGCVNDMLAVKQFLENRVARDRLKMEVLMNERATRTNIVRMFEKHLGKAKEGDVAFFYYSGHGSQERAHEAFRFVEPDMMNETFVCYDSRQFDGMDLADKELATLLELVAQNNPHIVVVADCCNSGDISRSLEAVSRSVPTPADVRPLDSYILPRKNNTDRSALSVDGSQQILMPNSRHVTLSAAQSFQLAKETRLGGVRRGVFTFSLLEVLQNATGALTYSDLIRKVRNLVLKRTYDQDPQLYAFEEGDLDLAFLGGTVENKGEYFLLTHDADKGWILDGGAVHGIVGPGFDGETTVLAVFEDGTPVEDMKVQQALGEVGVTTVEAGSSQVSARGHLRLDPDKAYRARIINMPVNPLLVCFRALNDKGKSIRNNEGRRLALKALAESQLSFYLKEVDKPDEADYHLIAQEDLRFATRDANDPERTPGYVIIRKTDADDQPLVEQLVGFTMENAHKAIENLNHIARWERILETNNPGSSISEDSVRLELFHPTENQMLPTRAGGYVFSYTDADDPNNLPAFRLKLVNTSHRRLYCSLLYMSSQFAIKTQLLPGGGVWLESGQEVWAISGNVFRAKIADALLAFGKKEVNEVFKLIVSTTEYKADALKQDELNLPKPAFRSMMKHDTRSLFFSEPANKNVDDWNATELTVTIRKED
ncbi:MAG: caspase family protein [Bacteroidetes bacterium]|nr:MAG: caspase family protein [Bacteroidota bacterium]